VVQGQLLSVLSLSEKDLWMSDKSVSREAKPNLGARGVREYLALGIARCVGTVAIPDRILLQDRTLISPALNYRPLAGGFGALHATFRYRYVLCLCAGFCLRYENLWALGRTVEDDEAGRETRDATLIHDQILLLGHTWTSSSATVRVRSEQSGALRANLQPRGARSELRGPRIC